MAKILPFRGLLYNPHKVEDMSEVMAPPYDVISSGLQEKLYHRHPNNIVRLILGKTCDDDTTGSNRYTRAAADLKRWRSEGMLIQDGVPSIYFYVQTYTLKNGESRSRKGFIARVLLEELGKGGIYPHERTLSGPKVDRLKLLEACRANFSCIFSLYSQPGLEINGILEDSIGAPPLLDVTDDDGVTNKLWRISEQSVIRAVTEAMAGKPVYIADGHHRYETAINYRNAVRERSSEWTGGEPENYVMMYFSNMDDCGMTILPTHRVVHGLSGLDGRKFLGDCSSYFDMEEIEFDGRRKAEARQRLIRSIEEKGVTAPSFGLALRGNNSYFALTLRDREKVRTELGGTVPEVLRDLDVTLLHVLVLDKILGIGEEAQARQENLLYKKDADEALDAVEKGCQLAFILNPVKMEQMKRVSESGHVFPQKTTYFYPKLLTGLVINPLE